MQSLSFLFTKKQSIYEIQNLKISENPARNFKHYSGWRDDNIIININDSKIYVIDILKLLYTLNFKILQ